MAGLVPAIHALPSGTKDVDAGVKPGHDEVEVSAQRANQAALNLNRDSRRRLLKLACKLRHRFLDPQS
jgi:hypothetical protein